MLKKRSLWVFLVLQLVMGSWKGYVALFEPGNPEPRQIFPALVASLPEEDQRALASGIPIRNPTQLQQAMEDYLS